MSVSRTIAILKAVKLGYRSDGSPKSQYVGSGSTDGWKVWRDDYIAPMNVRPTVSARTHYAYYFTR